MLEYREYQVSSGVDIILIKWPMKSIFGKFHTGIIICAFFFFLPLNCLAFCAAYTVTYLEFACLNCDPWECFGVCFVHESCVKVLTPTLNPSNRVSFIYSSYCVWGVPFCGHYYESLIQTIIASKLFIVKCFRIALCESETCVLNLMWWRAWMAWRSGLATASITRKRSSPNATGMR